MKKCNYCGQENEQSATHCGWCGTDEFVVPKGEPAPEAKFLADEPPSGSRTHTVGEIPSVYARGRFRLWEAGANVPKGRRSIVSSLGGFKVGILTVGSKGIVLEQRLSIAGGFVISILCVIPTLMLVVAIGALVSGSYHPVGRTASPIFSLVLIAVLLVPPFLVTLWVRRFRRVFVLADVIHSEIHESEIEIHLRQTQIPSSPAAPTVLHLFFKPFDSGGLSSLAKALSSSPAGVKDTRKEDQADFLRRLTAATPKAWVTPVLAGLNVVVFLLLSIQSRAIFNLPLATLVNSGADFGLLTVNCQQWWRLLTSCFIHVGLIHLVCNMYALYVVGRLTEQLFGNWFFLFIYLGSGLIASLTSIWFNPAIVSVGASGAIFGVFGALLGYLAREGGGLPRSLVSPVAKGASVFVGWNLIYGFLNTAVNHATGEAFNAINNTTHVHTSGTVIDMGAHAGGLVAGLILGYLGASPLDFEPRKGLVLKRSVALSSGIAVLMILLMIPVLVVNQPDVGRMKSLGTMYLRGEGVAKNPKAAVVWFGQAAQEGDLGSQNLLGSLFYEGSGVGKDIPEAIKWFSMAGEQGDINAEKVLARIYLTGEGVSTNTSEGVKWLTKAAEQGDVEVQKTLVQAYYKGDVVERNLTKSLKWARKIGEEGDLKYQTMLARMYYNGEEVPPDKAEAATWYRLAANQGDTNAQAAIGLMYANGDGIEKNPVEAWKWLTLSGDNRDDVPRQREMLGLKMSADQKQEAERDVQTFLRLQARRRSR